MQIYRFSYCDYRNFEGHLKAKEVFLGLIGLYPTRSGLVTAFQETKKLLHNSGRQRMDGQCQGRPEGENIDLMRIGEATRNREVCRSLCKSPIVIRQQADEREKRRRYCD